MLKKIVLLGLLAALLPSVAGAAVTNRDMQLMGGVVVSNANDSFFFAPMEEGLTKHWGLYALSSCASGPMREIQDGYPAQLVHADNDNVYFFGYTDADRTILSLFCVNIASGATEELLTNVSSTFVEDSDVFLYVSASNPYTLRRYDIESRKDTSIKDMSNSKKKIYDAAVYKGTLYFTTKADSGGAEDGYTYQPTSGKATNLDKPSPNLVKGLLYEGYRIYANDNEGSRVYAVRIGNTKAAQLGSKYAMSLTRPRFGEYIYTYDGDNNRLVACPLDGSTEQTLELDGDILTSVVMGGSADEVFFYDNGGIYAAPANLSTKTRLFDFDSATGGQMWTHIAPAGSNAILVMGYGMATYTNRHSLMPTGVYAFDRSTGAMLFGYPEHDSENPVEYQMPDAIGDVPVEQREDEEYFVF